MIINNNNDIDNNNDNIYNNNINTYINYELYQKIWRLLWIFKQFKI